METLLPMEKIWEIIDDNPMEIYTAAWKAQIRGYQDGLGCINLKTGKIFGISLGQNEQNQVIDNNAYICIFCIDQNDSMFDKIEKEYNTDSVEEAIQWLSTQDFWYAEAKTDTYIRLQSLYEEVDL